jgi:hypothetical protein
MSARKRRFNHKTRHHTPAQLELKLPAQQPEWMLKLLAKHVPANDNQHTEQSGILNRLTEEPGLKPGEPHVG